MCPQVYVCVDECAFLRPHVWVLIVSPGSRVSITFLLHLFCCQPGRLGLCYPCPPQTLPHGREAWGNGSPRTWVSGLWESPPYLPRASIFWVFMQEPRTPARMGGKEKKHFEGS